MKKIKVMFISHSAELNGAEGSLMNIFANIDRDKFEIYLVIPGKGPMKEEALRMGIPVFIIQYDRYLVISKMALSRYLHRIFINLISIFKIKSLADKLNIDILYTNTGVIISGALTARLIKKPHIWHIHEIIGCGHGELKSPIFGSELVFKIMYNLSSRIIVNSETVKQKFPCKYFDKIITVYYGFRINVKNVSNEERNRVKRQYGIKEKQKVISIIASICENKGQREAILAMPMVIKEDQDCVLLLAGTSTGWGENYRAGLSDIVRQYDLQNAVIFTGFKKDVSEVYKITDILLVPSGIEAFPRVIIEAKLYGVPVIANKVGGIPEIIKDGINGVLLNSRKPAVIAETILNLLRAPDKAREYAKEAMYLAAERFSMDKMIAEIEGVLINAFLNQKAKDFSSN